MNLEHVSLFLARKDIVSYSILKSLYEASDENSQVGTLLSDPDVLFSIRIFAKRPKSFRDIQKGLDAKLSLKEGYNFEYMKKLYMVGSEEKQKTFLMDFSNLLCSMYYEKSCYGDGDMVECYNFDSIKLGIVAGLFMECVNYSIWSKWDEHICMFPYEVVKILLESGYQKYVAKGILRLVENGCLNVRNVFDAVESEEKFCEMVFESIETKSEMQAFVSSDLALRIDEDILEEEAKKYDVVVDLWCDVEESD